GVDGRGRRRGRGRGRRRGRGRGRGRGRRRGRGRGRGRGSDAPGGSRPTGLFSGARAAILARVSLRAPAAISVEIRAGARRFFRLSDNVGADGLRLLRPIPLEPGHPAEILLTLPDAAATPLGLLRATTQLAGDDGEGDHGCRELTFVEPSSDARQALARYVA